MRRDVYERIKIFMIHGEKPNFSELGRRWNVDRRTVKAAYERELTGKSKNKQSIVRPSKLDGFREIITEKYTAGCSAMSIFKFIQKRGFTGRYTIVREFCRSFKQAETHKATVRVEHAPGLSGQVDWKENITLHDKNGTAHTFSIFLYVLPYSKKKYLTLTLDQKQDSLFNFLTEAFKYTGGVPREIWFDNMATVVDRNGGSFTQTKFNSRFLSYANDAGFKPIACRPFRPQTKGCVEALARTMDRLKPYDGEFETLEELTGIVNELRKDLNDEVSQASGKTPNELISIEKEHLASLPQGLERYYVKVQQRKVSKDSMVKFRKHQYSVNPKYIGKTVEIKETSDQKGIKIFYAGSLISAHKLTAKPFIYHRGDLHEVLKTDLFKDIEVPEEELDKYMHNNLEIYDL